MNLTPVKTVGSATSSLKDLCVHCYLKVLRQIARTKDAIYHEWRSVLGRQERLLHLALNEAEAAAWQTPFPHLVFPALALEKAQAVASWNQHQQTVRRQQLSAGGVLWV